MLTSYLSYLARLAFYALREAIEAEQPAVIRLMTSFIRERVPGFENNTDLGITILDNWLSRRR
jgi:hypothetical protein